MTRSLTTTTVDHRRDRKARYSPCSFDQRSELSMLLDKLKARRTAWRRLLRGESILVLLSKGRRTRRSATTEGGSFVARDNALQYLTRTLGHSFQCRAPAPKNSAMAHLVEKLAHKLKGDDDSVPAQDQELEVPTPHKASKVDEGKQCLTGSCSWYDCMRTYS